MTLFPFHWYPLAHSTRLRHCSPARGMSHRADGRLVSEGGRVSRASLPCGVLDWRSEMLGSIRQFESLTRFENTPSCGLVSQGSSPRSSGSLTDSPQVYLASANRRRCHGRIRRVVRKGRLLADALATHSSKAAYRHAALCGGFCFIEPCGHARRMTLVPMRLEAAPGSRSLCNSDVSNELICVKYVNVLNKITTDIAFEGILCYNHTSKEKNHEA